MSEELKKTTFKAFITLQRGFDLPRQNRQIGDYPVVASTTIKDYHNEYKIQPPGVITGRSGSLGAVQYLNVPFWPLNTTLWVKDFKGNDPKFVFYFLKTIGLERYNSGAGVPTLNRNHLDSIEVYIPKLSTQHKIASILSAYDDLIENNLRRIKILEEIAQNLYQEWFVKFRFPGHESIRFIDSPLGRIPEGWEVVPLGILIEIRKGKNITKKTVVEGVVPVVAGGLTPAYFHNKSNTQHPVITVSASGANSGFVNLYYEDIWASDCSYIDANETPFVYYYYLLFKYFQTNITRLQRGSAQPHVYPKDLMEFEVVDCPMEVIKIFDQQIHPIFKMIKNLSWKNRNLIDTRDLILPKLISGELDVSGLI